MAQSKTSRTELLPEEGVRQWFLALLQNSGVESYRVATEYGVMINGRRLRVDIAVFERGELNVKMVVECKAPGVKITHSTLTQAAIYNTVLGARYVALTNGEVTIIYDTTEARYMEHFPTDL